MAKRVCAICGTSLGLLTLRTDVSDGSFCSKCLIAAGIGSLSSPKNHTVNSVTQLIQRNQMLLGKYRQTKSVANKIFIDEENKIFKIGNDVFEYHNLLGFELIEDEESIIKSGGIGRAVVGGVLFGAAGAIVGSATAGRKTKSVCKSMRLRITLKGAPTDIAYIDFIKTETKTNSFVYKASQQSAQACISALQIISSESNCESNAEEIIKFKSLLDSGIITQEEFEKKKKQILGI